MQEFFLNAQINIMHDLDGAIKATYKGVPIISCILGTGSNSCVYDGEKIIENAPSLGYILGDEASGNYFGKQLINLAQAINHASAIRYLIQCNIRNR